MIFNIPVGGAKKVDIILNGAPGETVTYSGKDSGSVVLNGNGKGTIYQVKAGAYTFTGSISGSKAATIKNTGTVNMYPDGAIFWYGNGDAEGDSLWSKCGGWLWDTGCYPSGTNLDEYAKGHSITGNTNDTTLTYSFPNEGKIQGVRAGFKMANAVAHSGYSKLKINATADTGKFYTTETNGAGFTPVDSGAAAESLSLTPSEYLVFFDFGNVYSMSRTTVIKAIWLE